jgi:hypothetical protein
MKKGNYIGIYVMIACLSHKKKRSGFQSIDKLLHLAFVNEKAPFRENENTAQALVVENSLSLQDTF